MTHSETQSLTQTGLVEVSGWDEGQIFFVERSELGWDEYAGKHVTLIGCCRNVRSYSSGQFSRRLCTGPTRFPMKRSLSAAARRAITSFG